ncbi:hypothetical protein ZIOFF_059043 [Zingiber officinale]|uniref:RRM domain-containing protein n=1 Tax=Zingiber officinale TaxID=94328 RepID=A0A8J5F4E7_ZINOF|nr:hypothetical protein ZIOFF_059043 [Zingiber officinale]
MGRYGYRSHSRSYSPRRYSRSPPRRKRYDDPRDRYRGGGGGGREYRDYRSASSGLLIRNIALDARPEDLRIPFERFGPVKDVYLPKNYYTGEPRGFGFVKFRHAEDAAVAKQHMNRQIIGGREISIVYAEENRKTPQEMRMTARVSPCLLVNLVVSSSDFHSNETFCSERYMGGRNRRSMSRSPKRQYHSYSHSPSPPKHGSRRKAACGSCCLSLAVEEEWLAACFLCARLLMLVIDNRYAKLITYLMPQHPGISEQFASYYAAFLNNYSHMVECRDNGRGSRDYYSLPRSVSPSLHNGREYGSPDVRDYRSKRSERQSPGPEDRRHVVSNYVLSASLKYAIIQKIKLYSCSLSIHNEEDVIGFKDPVVPVTVERKIGSNWVM